MSPSVFTLLAADPGVRAVFGASPVRVYPFGEAPQGVALPYAVWQIISGSPENYLGDRPDADVFGLQFDVYAAQAGQADDAVVALRDALEVRAHIVSWRGSSRDPETKRFRVGFDVDWWERRG